MKNEIAYLNLEKLSWDRVRELNSSELPSPYSVHIPLNLPESQQLIYCDKALNVYTLPIPPNMNSMSRESYGIIETIRLMLCSFALWEPAFVPDFKLSQAQRKANSPGEIQIDYFVRNLLYTFEYCTDKNSGIHIKGTVTNLGQQARKAHLRFKVTHPRETAVFNYHYVPFAWDASNWQNDDSVFFQQNKLYSETGQCGEVFPQDFEIEHEEYKSFAGANFQEGFNCSTPYWVHHNFQLPEVRNTIHLSTELAPGKKAQFELVLITAPGTIPAPNYAAAVQENQQIWASYVPQRATVNFGDTQENEIFTAIQNCTLQLLIRRDNLLQPSQGGSSERFFVWIWEALQQMRPMIQLGYWPQVRQVLEFFLSLQDSGTPPRGEFTSVAGAIGTTGPRWANSTGSALMLASEYLLLSEDQEFLKQHIADLRRAAEWIIHEIRATRQPGAINYGLMPKACATDGDYGYIYSFTDTFSCVGLEKFCQVLQKFGLEKCDEMTAEAAQYRGDLNAAVARVSRPDGFIDRKLNDEGEIAYCFRNTCNALSLLESGFCSADDPYLKKFIAYSEKHNFQGPFCAPMTYDLFYISNVEKIMAEAYICRGEYKKAWTAFRTLCQYGVTSDVYLTQERYCSSNPALTCWQPNGSANGRYLELALETLYFEKDQHIYILCGIAPFEYAHRENFRIRNLRTKFGRLDLEVSAGQLTMTWEKAVPEGTQLILPDYFTEPVTKLKTAVFHFERSLQLSPEKEN